MPSIPPDISPKYLKKIKKRLKKTSIGFNSIKFPASSFDGKCAESSLLKNPCLNDINWRDFSDYNMELLRKNPNKEILVQTDIAIRTAYAYNINMRNMHMECFNETAVKFAFI